MGSGLCFSVEPIVAQHPVPSIPHAVPDLSVIEEGKHYRKIGPTVLLNKNVQELIAQDPGKIQVIEFFSYACFWCQRLHPIVNAWVEKMPSNVAFHRYPLQFHKQWVPLAKAYYVVKALGRSHELDPVFFKAIHETHINLPDEKLLQTFFAEHGVPEKQFLELYGSFTLNQEVAKANELGNAYEIAESPVLIVNGPSGSYIFSARMVGSEQGVIKVLEFLIEREAKQLPSQ